MLVHASFRMVLNQCCDSSGVIGRQNVETNATHMLACTGGVCKSGEVGERTARRQSRR